jgi:predicted DNA-binding transcriptional regulator AlpA
MLKVIARMLRSIADKIDDGSISSNPEETMQVMETIKGFVDKEKRLSKYEACRYLNVSRATFDNYVRAGKLPRGKHEAGFKELSWSKKDLDAFIKSCKS